MAPAEPDRQTAKRYAEAMRAGLWVARDVEPIDLKVAHNGDACVMDVGSRLSWSAINRLIWACGSADKDRKELLRYSSGTYQSGSNWGA